MSTPDVLITIPLIPLFPVLATWWLPWERWLPSKIPKWILGPYLVYAAFAAWHFDMPWWVCLMAGSIGTILIIGWAVQDNAKQEKRQL
jgi:hypothetical protein